MRTLNGADASYLALRDIWYYTDTRKVKPIWILLKQVSERQWHELGHMQAGLYSPVKTAANENSSNNN